jgi:hypothetical protein
MSRRNILADIMGWISMEIKIKITADVKTTVIDKNSFISCDYYYEESK